MIRRRGFEILDDPGVDPAIRQRAHDDIARSNRWLGGLRAALAEYLAALGAAGPGSVLLDVGTGAGDIPLAVARARPGTIAIGLDASESLLRAHRDRLTFAVCGSALALPFADHSVDVVGCSQVLHHFEDADAARLLGEMHRVARCRGVVVDLHRSWFAAVGFWLVSWPLRFHSVTRHDGVVSVLRGFTVTDLKRLVKKAAGVEPVVRRHPGFRITATWGRE